jgi:RNA polymerase sigma-70 factor (ECF subfamily)
MTGDDFAKTLRSAQDGDEDAFRLLFRAVQPGLLRYLDVVAGELADDVAADTWVSVVRGLSRFTGDESAFGAWVFTIARARLRDEQRRLYRRPIPADPAPLLADSSAGQDPADQAVESAGTVAALALIATLPPDQGEVVLLRHVVGFDVAQTAQILGKRPGAVRVASHRGLARLRTALGGDVELPAGGGVTNARFRAIGGVT